MLIVDGGGTALKVWQRTEKGNMHQITCIAGNFNIQTGRLTNVLKALTEVAKHSSDHTILIGLAGLSDEAEKQALENKLRTKAAFKGKTLCLMSDWELQLELHFPGQNGMIAVLGTGSVFAAKVEGKRFRVGGYGRWIGDRGSGMAIGISALWHYLRLLDGFFEDERFSKAMRRHFTDREDTLRKVYQEQFQVQTLAPEVIALAAKGNPTAQTILETEAQCVADFVGLLKKKTAQAHLPLKLCGGLVEKPNYYRNLVEQVIARQAW
jgi:glucosamine kinase